MNQDKFEKAKETLELSNTSVKACTCAEITSSITKRYKVSELIIIEEHKKAVRNGLAETLIQVRSQVWLIRGRQVVKKLLKGFGFCKNVEGLSYPSPALTAFTAFR